mmetsp:Transcript_33676/g.96775  ORF Transcript_33676/g.96775 Transcript_33676/m.96775 type:complete len:228 (-) Transcript_33676:469-1152(-)
MSPRRSVPSSLRPLHLRHGARRRRLRRQAGLHPGRPMPERLLCGEAGGPLRGAGRGLHRAQPLLRRRDLRPCHGPVQRRRALPGPPALRRRRPGHGLRPLHRRPLPRQSRVRRAVPYAGHGRVQRPGGRPHGALRRRCGGRAGVHGVVQGGPSVRGLLLRFPSLQRLRHRADTRAQRRQGVGLPGGQLQPCGHLRRDGGARRGGPARRHLPAQGHDGGHAYGLRRCR